MAGGNPRSWTSWALAHGILATLSWCSVLSKTSGCLSCTARNQGKGFVSSPELDIWQELDIVWGHPKPGHSPEGPLVTLLSFLRVSLSGTLVFFLGGSDDSSNRKGWSTTSLCEASCNLIFLLLILVPGHFHVGNWFSLLYTVGAWGGEISLESSFLGVLYDRCAERRGPGCGL